MYDRLDQIVHRRRLALALVTAAAAIILVAGALGPSNGELSHGFAAYYTASRLVLDGADPTRFYENRWFLEQTVRLGFADTPDIFNVNPPPASLLFLPLMPLSPDIADVVWNLANVALLAALITVLLRTLRDAGFDAGPRSPLAWALVATALAFNPVWRNFEFGQAYILLALLLALAMRAYVLDRDRQLGICLGIMLAVKSAGLILWALPVLDRRLRASAWGVAAVLAVVLAATPLLGLSVWWEYAQWLPSLINQRWTGVTAYQTVASFVHHNFRAVDGVSPRPLLDAPGLVPLLSTLSNLTLAGLAVAAGWLLPRSLNQRRARLARFAMLSALMIPLQPVGEEHHYVMALPALFVALALSWEATPHPRGRLVILLAVSGAFLLIAPLPTTSTRLQDGAAALLSYPKLAGSLLITGSAAAYLVSAPAFWRERISTRLGAIRPRLARGH